MNPTTSEKVTNDDQSSPHKLLKSKWASSPLDILCGLLWSLLVTFFSFVGFILSKKIEGTDYVVIEAPMCFRCFFLSIFSSLLSLLNLIFSIPSYNLRESNVSWVIYVLCDSFNCVIFLNSFYTVISPKKKFTCAKVQKQLLSFNFYQKGND